MKRKVSTYGGYDLANCGTPLYVVVLKILREACDEPISIDGIMASHKKRLGKCYTVARFLYREPLTLEDAEKARQTIRNAMDTIRRKGHEISSFKEGGEIRYCCA